MNDVKFTEGLGRALIKSVTMTTGGGWGWFCTQCSKKHAERPKNECGNRYPKFNDQKFKQAVCEYFDVESVDEDQLIEYSKLFLEPLEEAIEENGNLHDTVVCSCKNFVYKDPPGEILSKYDGEWLDLYNSFNKDN